MKYENITKNNESIENNNEIINTDNYEYSTNDTDYISVVPGNADSTNTGIYKSVSAAELPEHEPNSEVLSVSSGDILGIYTVSANETNQTEYTPYLETINGHLEKIDKSLALIAFFIIFAWCANKVVNAVRSFCGIGLKSKESVKWKI